MAGTRQEPKASSGWQRPKYMEHFLLLSQSHRQGAALQITQPGLKSEPRLKAGVARSGFAAMLQCWFHV